MPFPTTRHTVPDVGAPGGQRPGAIPCAHAQVGGLLRGGEFEDWQIRPLNVREIRRTHVRTLPEKAVAAPLTRQAYVHRARQCPIPPCHIIGAPVTQIPEGIDPAVFAAIQPATCLHRASLEAGRRLATHKRFFVTLGELLHAIESCFDCWRKPNAVLFRLCGII